MAKGGVLEANVAATSIGIGDVNTQAKGTNSAAIGNNVTVNGLSSFAVGNNITASKNRTISVGNDVNARYEDSIFLGDGTGTVGGNTVSRSILIGKNAQVGDLSITNPKFSQAIAIGSGNVLTSNKPSITEGAWARGDQSIAIGGNVVAYGNSSIALGGDDLDKVGDFKYQGTEEFSEYNDKDENTGKWKLTGKSIRDIYRKMTGDTMNSGEYENSIAGEGAVAFGVQANSSAALSLAIGTKSKATALGATALGAGASWQIKFSCFGGCF